MNVTIQSADTIDQVLAVVGALYKVEVAVAAAPSEPAAAPSLKLATQGAKVPAAAARTPRRRAAATARPAKLTARTAGPTADSAAIRAWARENGVSVSTRGRISATVQQQYQAAAA